jgi:hypothetical protein
MTACASRCSPACLLHPITIVEKCEERRCATRHVTQGIVSVLLTDKFSSYVYYNDLTGPGLFVLV